MHSLNFSHHPKYGHVRMHTVILVSTFDLMMSCARINGITGGEFKAKILANWDKLHNAYEHALADTVKGEREAAAHKAATVCSSVDLFLFLFYIDTELDKANDPTSTAVMKQYFLDIKEHMIANRDDPFWECNVIESRLPEVSVPAA